MGYNINFMRQSACLVFSPIMVDNYAAFLARQWVGLQTMMARTYKAIHFSRLGPEFLVCCLAHRGSTGVFLLVIERPGMSIVGQLTESVSPRF